MQILPFISHVQCFLVFNYSVTLFGIMCPISPCLTEFFAYYEHSHTRVSKVFLNYLMFAYVWHHGSCMTMIT
jgi:hypothetical protein